MSVTVEPLTEEDLQEYEAHARRVLDTTPGDTEEGRIRRAIAQEMLSTAETCRALLHEPRPDPKVRRLSRRVEILEAKNEQR